MSCDPILEKYLPVTPNSDEDKQHNSRLPGQGGVFNPINLNLYHYAGNNPIKYTDPDGKQMYNPLEYILFWLFNSGTEGKFAKLHYDAAMGDENAQYMVKHLWISASFELGIRTADTVSDVSDYATICLIAIGCPEGAAITKSVSFAADMTSIGLKFSKAWYTGSESDWNDARAGAFAVGIDFVVSTVINKKFAKIRVDIGKNGKYYQLGRNGALKTWEGIKKKMIQDLAPEVGGKTAEEITKKVYEQIKPILNEDK